MAGSVIPVRASTLAQASVNKLTKCIMFSDGYNFSTDRCLSFPTKDNALISKIKVFPQTQVCSIQLHTNKHAHISYTKKVLCFFYLRTDAKYIALLFWDSGVLCKNVFSSTLTLSVVKV